VIEPVGDLATEEATSTATRQPDGPAPTSPAETAAPIEPLNPTATADDGETGGEIVPIEGVGGPAEATATATTSVTPNETEVENGAGTALTEAPALEPVPPDGGQRLALSDGALVLAETPGVASLGTGTGVLQGVPTANGQAVAFCAENAPDECVELSADADGVPATDTPLGWVEGRAVYMRQAGDTVAYYAVNPDGSDTTDLLPPGGPELALSGPVIDLGDSLLVPGAGVWIRLTGFSGSVVGDNPYGEISLVRTNLPGSIVGFVADGQIVVAPIDAPGAPLAQFAVERIVDFDVAPDGQRIVISTGATIVITDFEGVELGRFSNPAGVEVGSVLWLEDGIYFVDQSNGVLRRVDPEGAG
ncbi:MAG TPA: hypothetical protein VK992_06580, partial [Candidatus Caenarcaniphilales bacterium]|nr:hypothetical protein [Candidatus Caenarcaniphilales bacterium]